MTRAFRRYCEEGGRIGILAVSALLCIGAWRGEAARPADHRESLSRSACIERALAQSGVARNARTDEDIAHAIRNQARSLALPQLSASGAYTRMDELQSFEVEGTSVEIGELDNYELKGEISQLLYSGGQVSAALRAARLEEQRAAAARQHAESALVRDVRILFARVLRAREAVLVQEESLAQLTSFLEMTQRMRTQETASDFDVLTARTRVAACRPPLIAARNDRELAVEDLCRILDLDAPAVHVDGTLAEVVIPFSLEELVGIAMTNNPSLKEMKTRCRLGREAVVSARSDGRPELRARAEYTGTDPYGFGESSGDLEWHWNAGVVLSWNLWDGDLTRQVVRQRKLEADKSRVMYDELVKSVRLQVRQAFLEAATARKAIDASCESVDLAGRALGIAETRFREGLATHLEFMDANLSMTMARMEWINSLYTLVVAAAHLDYACGYTVETLSMEMDR